MREAFILGFRFRYLNNRRRWQHFFHKIGSVTRDGVVLNDRIVFFRDIYRVGTHRNTLIISLMPFATTTREVCEHVIPRYNCLYLQMDKHMVRKVEAVINLRCTTMIAEDRWGPVPKDIRIREFKKAYCPRCDALHDISDMINSPWLYCKYCHALFDYYGYMMPNSEQYKVCPNCEYYGRVQDYQEYNVYYLGKDREFRSRVRHYCDTCVHTHFTKNFWKNLTFGVGAFVSLWEKLRSKSGRNPVYKDMVEANYLAQNGKMVEADILYSSIIFKNHGHPGIHMNYGLAYLQNGDRNRAAFQFKKALEACANYLPVIEILRRNVDLLPEQLQQEEEEE